MRRAARLESAKKNVTNQMFLLEEQQQVLDASKIAAETVASTKNVSQDVRRHLKAAKLDSIDKVENLHEEIRVRRRRRRPTSEQVCVPCFDCVACLSSLLFFPQDQNDLVMEVGEILGRPVNGETISDEDALTKQLDELMAGETEDQLDNIDVVDREPASKAATATATATAANGARRQAAAPPAAQNQEVSEEELEELEGLKSELAY